MLILTRYQGQSIIINDDIIITFCGYNYQQKQGRLGITAPRENAVHREEIYQRIHGDNTNALIQSAQQIISDGLKTTR